ncbi:16S rRNA (guanine(966)-N(2))-methyltransferase RsmD [Planomicrobium chinense]|uniref:16S rRNA (guanine(966)-N(2))-methyltransferase RsmD n=1 Tax=Planococcus chinensis TaxID=272917 RepID=UPI001CC530BC|nr:16S rRNA (guanine(966)-N(2))-methyltransferase RsmD [Planococcus chinensis]MBZ5200325.1 16S rRNA (guanine(966)-N(2))-methyltransferase RsmD [Planococcus chinensis]MCP2033190.1 16S rRNA (guanine(966)-N(2))-methyltransferase RsmD [Planomicrobium sp. HSC-17F08]
MRVVAGTVKGIPLKAVPGTSTRPTTDKVKESIFNMIGPFFDGGNALDLFAGSGGLGIEALSRGIDKVIFTDKDRKAVDTIRANLEKTRLTDQAEVYKTDADRALKAIKKNNIQARLMFLDPPYHMEKAYGLMDKAAEMGILTEDSIVVCEHAKEVELQDRTVFFERFKKELYGTTIISIYRFQGEEGEEFE